MLYAINGDDGCGQYQFTDKLTAQVSCLELRFDICLALSLHSLSEQAELW